MAMTLGLWFAACAGVSGQLFVQDPVPERLIDACPDYSKYSAAPQ